MQSMAPVERSSPYPASCQGEGLRIPKSVRVILRKKNERARHDGTITRRVLAATPHTWPK